MESKFKGKSVEDNSWVCGDFLRDFHGTYINPFSVLSTEMNEDFIEVYPETVREYTGKNDKNDKEIYYSDIFRFELFYGGEWIELEGSFNFNDEELRVEIDILPKYEKDGFIVLWYDFLKMRDFEIIGSTYERV